MESYICGVTTKRGNPCINAIKLYGVCGRHKRNARYHDNDPLVIQFINKYTSMIREIEMIFDILKYRNISPLVVNEEIEITKKIYEKSDIELIYSLSKRMVILKELITTYKVTSYPYLITNIAYDISISILGYFFN